MDFDFSKNIKELGSHDSYPNNKKMLNKPKVNEFSCTPQRSEVAGKNATPKPEATRADSPWRSAHQE